MIKLSTEQDNAFVMLLVNAAPRLRKPSQRIHQQVGTQ